MDRTGQILTVTSQHDTRPPAFGELLRQFRMARGLTQEELAERATLSPRSIFNCESGSTRRPQRETVRLLADALALSSEERALLTATLFPPQVPQVEPAPSALPVPPTHLPTSLTPLLGREHELASIIALLTEDTMRLVTIVGTGGVGKTRLALGVAAAMHDIYAAGVYFVSLAPVREAEVLWQAAAQAIGVKPTGAQTPYDALCAWLRDRHALLVLDNFEHLLSESVMIANLLASCPHAAVLTTSRAPLRVRGEQEYPLAPLATPAPQAPASTVAASPAVQVFAHYARAVRPAFQVTGENAATVAAICARLEGIPLALELAAARIRGFSAVQLLKQLTPRLPALVDGPRDVAPRQRTMRDTIAWSDRLLTDEERHVFAALAVFAGGATPDAVEAVCGTKATAHADALVLQSLLAIASEPDDGPRYVMLETVREYAWKRAEQANTLADARRHHALFFLALAEEARPELSGRKRQHWMHQLTIEIDNLRAALRWAVEMGDAATSLRLTRALQPYWRGRGHVREGVTWAQAALDMAETASVAARALRAAALVSAGSLRYWLADYEGAIADAREALALARADGDELIAADALSLLGILSIGRGELDQARTYLEECLALYRLFDRPSATGRVLYSLANEAFMRGEHARAIKLTQESYTIADMLGEEMNTATSLSMIARTYNAMGEPARALDFARDAVTHYTRAGEESEIAPTLFILGDALHALHRDAEAIPLLDRGIAVATDLGAARDEFWGVMSRAEAMYAMGDHAGAAASFARGLMVAKRIASKQPYAPGLEGIAILGHTLGRHWEATTLLGAATTLQRTIGMPQRSEGRAVIDAAQRALGDEAFAAAWDAGQAMPLDDAVALAMDLLATVSRDQKGAAPRVGDARPMDVS